MLPSTVTEGCLRIENSLKEIEIKKGTTISMKEMLKAYQKIYHVKFDTTESLKYFNEPDPLMAIQRFMSRKISLAFRMMPNNCPERLLFAQVDFLSKSRSMPSFLVKNSGVET
uniref:Uncharacterized protein n=1 Tax=Panagrolaimus sp. JU765 TaxID=591449 RepID=A0AC34R8G9_9BILA